MIRVKLKISIDDVLDQCKERMETPPDKLQGGMGDIFVKLSLLCENNVEGFTDTHDTLKNIYGNILKHVKQAIVQEVGIVGDIVVKEEEVFIKYVWK